tara:strand:- start:14 stop:454 length:441 start_codon:yes stop_codon:yes gene_type:complete
MNVVYKIYCKNSEIKEIYIGSSKKFKARKYKHKSDCNNPNNRRYNIKLYKFIRANGGFQNFDYEILLETIEDDIKKIEQKYIDELKPALNCINACGFDKKEYHKKYKEKIKEQMKEYQKKNKEKIREYQRLYYLKKKQQKLKNLTN